jgi:hypothetical protein
MADFFKWISSPISDEEVIVWFNIHNMIYEKIELFGDFFKSLNQIIIDTYLGDNVISETTILLTQEDKKNHFEWCWDKVIINFSKENIKISNLGEHKDYFEDFYMETFYNQSEKSVRINISNFINDVFDLEKTFTKSDLDLLTEIYKLLNKNIQ